MSRLETIRRPVRARWWDALTRTATDVTAASTSTRTLVVAPHPDDETIGAGATIARRSAVGTPVDVVVLSDGASLLSTRLDRATIARTRQREVATAAEILGVRELVEYSLPDDALAHHLDAIVTRLLGLVERTAPDEILVTSGLDWHRDHRVASHAARLVAAATGTALAEFPVWFRADGPWRSWSPQQSLSDRAWSTVADPVRYFRSQRVERVATGPYLSQKEAAMDAHRSQFVGMADDPDWPVLDHAWRAPFLGPYELFFRIR